MYDYTERIAYCPQCAANMLGDYEARWRRWTCHRCQTAYDATGGLVTA